MGCEESLDQLVVTAVTTTTTAAPTTYLPSVPRNDKADAHFLITASFGPTRASLAELNAMDSHEQWVRAQMDLPVGSHRVYYRERVNPQLTVPNLVAGPRLGCSKGSRWQSAVFRRADVGKRVTVHDGRISLDGKHVSDIDPSYSGNGLTAPVTCTDVLPSYLARQGATCTAWARFLLPRNCHAARAGWVQHKYCQQTCFDGGSSRDGDDCSIGWPNLGLVGYVCSVRDGAGSWMRLSTSPYCNSSFVPMLNPAVWFSSPTEDMKTTLAFKVLSPGVITIDEEPASCRFGDVLQTDVESLGRFYRRESRMELLENTIASPAAPRSDFLGSRCPTAARNFLNEKTCRIVPGSGCGVPLGGSDNRSLVCGSTGEAASKPSAGHHQPFHMSDVYQNGVADYDFDGGPYGDLEYYVKPAKRNVWLAKALYGDDQLRQRMAWALSQIITVATPTLSVLDRQTELYVNFYDIFVRHAFGSYRDILREVTYSPIMGDWLTYINNKAVDVDGLFPDENYAREIMQVFSIGLWKLNRDGSRIKGADGNDVRTYENWNIFGFARVFTGLSRNPMRGNIEVNGNSANNVDPMRIHASWHDVYPKPNLDMGYLGDGYPLCSDLPPQHFLTVGSKFSFVGFSSSELGVLVLSQGTPLYAKLCGASGAPCNFAATVELSEALQCQGSECSATDVTFIQVENGFYEYIPPACVHPFFWKTGRIARDSGRGKQWWKSVRAAKCLHPAAKVAGPSCCAGCSNNPNSWMIKNGFVCENVSSTYSWIFPARCTPEHWGWAKFCMRTCWERGVGYPGYNCSNGNYRFEHACAYPNEKLTYAQAQARCASKGLEVCRDYVPPEGQGCGDAVWTPEECGESVLVHVDGRVSVGLERVAQMAMFPVYWETGFPAQNETGGCPDDCTPDGASCSCTARTEERRVFDALPSTSALVDKLKVGAFAPTVACFAGCGGEVEAYSASGAYDAQTVFRCQNRYYKNVEHKVLLTNYQFRNPPTFTLKHDNSAKKVADEVDALIDHLFYHENTPQFLAYRLIQRFTTSNPSKKYVFDVQAAFRTGYFNGTKYSGTYGDLGATVAAIVLHPEARQGGTTSGALREPLLKVVHFMRSMEYKAKNGREIQFDNMMHIIGQWPYSAIDVFNFYHPEFQPEGFPDGVVGPEFQIWTMPNIIGWLNGMTSTLDLGHGHCNGGFGVNQGSCSGGGSFTFAAAAGASKNETSKNETIAELDLLLTGGRLGAHSIAVLAQEWDKASTDKAKLQAAQYASLVTPAFHTLGDTLLPTSPAQEPAPTLASPVRNYRAVVMMYLQGGVDSFQMLVPTNCRLHDEYRTIRESIALVPDQLLGISTTGQACANFGVHPSMPFLRSLYNSGEAAFVSDVGSLLEPLTAESYRSGGKRCNGEFSHIDSERNAQTLTCQTPSPTYRGAGGRLADALADGRQAYRTESFSMAGRSKWSLGFQTNPKIVDRRTGNVPLTYPTKIVSAMDNITSVKYENIFCEEYRQQLKDALRSNDELGEAFKSGTLSTGYDDGGSRLSQQLKQVARVVAARGARKAERDVFFTQLGGFDHHQGVVEHMEKRLREVDNALSAFVAELKSQGSFGEVTLVMNTDFGRALAPNSNAGSDHGWAGHTFVLGGSVNGGKVLNRYPETLLPGHAMDTFHGRIIPSHPWESIMVPIAEWMGVEPAQLRGVFPNIDNFNKSKHILPRTTVFSN